MSKNISKNLTIIITYPYQDPASRYRILQFVPDLELHYNINILTLLSSSFYLSKNSYSLSHQITKIFSLIYFLIKRIIKIFILPKQNIVFIQREAFPFFTPFFENLIRKKCDKMIYDFDDAIFAKPEGWKNWRDYFRDPQKVSEICRMADIVVCGNDFLRDYAKKYNSNSIVLPTVHKIRKNDINILKKTNNAVTIGWIGSWSTFRNLVLIQDVIKHMCFNYNIEILLIGSKNIYEFPNYNSKIRYHLWNLEEEEALLSQMDIGIMPLYNSYWELGKCGFKLVQYMTFGKPVVASAVGVNKQIVVHGKNGFLCNNNSEWLDSLTKLINSEKLRSNFGEVSLKLINEKYSYDNNLKNLEKILDE